MSWVPVTYIAGVYISKDSESETWAVYGEFFTSYEAAYNRVINALKAHW
jgi:hypothetical protein